MILLKLFLSFLKIGAFSFGGGIGMISIIMDTVLENNWMNEEEILNMIAISESTPGPIAVNIATFIGSNQAGFLGALVSTIGVILPSFIIILIISALLTKLIEFPVVKAFLGGVRPAVIGLILGTSITLLLSKVLGLTSGIINIDYKALIIIGLLLVFCLAFKLISKKSVSPILIIVVSGVLGIVIYGLI